MSTGKRHRLSGGTLLMCVLVIFGIIGTAAAQTGDSYCEITLEKCPYDYDGDTLVVPLDVVALSASLKACNISDETLISAGVAPSIMFVIDQSSSMFSVAQSFGNNNGPTPGFDMEGNRYKVTSAIIEHIYKEAPDAEVGIVVFASGLVLNSIDDQNLRRLSTTGTGNTGAYMPLTRLNSTDVEKEGVFGSSATNGYDILQNIVKTADRVGTYTTGSGQNRVEHEVQFTDLAYMTNPEANPLSLSNPASNRYTQGTNITEAFDAAKAAMARATAPKENQYIIFISDGEASTAGITQTEEEMNRYQQGIGVPTTFTIYLDVSGDVPQSIQTMTANIKANEYSDSNEELTGVWQMESDYDELLKFMEENIMSHVLAEQASGTPRRVTITSANVTDSSENVGGFTFRRRLPIDTSDVTPVNMNITYKVTIETIGNDGVVGPPTVVDSTIKYTFHIRRTTEVASDWQAAQHITANCGVKPTLSLLYNNVAVDTVKASMNALTVRLDNTGGLFDYGPSVNVTVFNLPDAFNPNGIRDTVTLTLTRSGNVYSASFPRTVSDAAAPGGTLEHMSLDSIIVLFRNPEIPLDTSRVGALYLSHTMAFYKNPPMNNPSDSIPGLTVTAVAGVDFPIYSMLVNSDGALEEWGGSFNPENVTWSVSGGVGTELKSGNKGDNTVFYTEVANLTYTVTAVYREGDMVVERTLNIVVVPGDPEYLQVVFDEASRNVLLVDPKILALNKEFEFKSDMNSAPFYVVERDRFGNLILDDDGNSGAGSSWGSNNTGTIIATPDNIGNKADVTRVGNSYAGGLQVIVTKNGLADTVNVSLLGDAAVAVGPNPFVPGVSKPIDMFANHPTVLETYRPILEGASANSNPGVTGSGKTGILVAVSAPSSINLQNGSPSVGPGGINNGGSGTRYAQASVMIYDAVGNVVWRSKPNNIILADDNVTYGFVWDGRNEKGRVVAPGTYLVRMVGSMSNGDKFSTQRKVGVRKDGTVN